MAISYGLDKTTNTAYNYATDYSAYFITPLYQVGTLLNPRKFSEIEFNFVKELATGEGIKFEYRVNLTDGWTTVKKADNTTLTLTHAILGAITTHKVSADIPAANMLQLRISLLGTATTTPELRNVILR